MLEHTQWPTGAGRDAGQPPPPLPDLATVDLRTLRVMDHPDLVAEVERVLDRALELGESWASGGDGLR
ncbi:hypothetical protein ACIGEZ_33180 [Streptomyces sp. NPDC085481]|uniref:hypothetical protein n=1 Tax=Streptomyces sp. NPDC085481 TaxID=3365727 RepID=UPI0037D29BDE